MSYGNNYDESTRTGVHAINADASTDNAIIGNPDDTTANDTSAAANSANDTSTNAGAAGGCPLPNERRCSSERAAATLLGRHLARLLRVVDLERAGEALEPDAYRLSARPVAAPREPPQQSGIRYEDMKGFVRHEPRLKLIARTLERALELGGFVDKGRPVSVDGFRLGNLNIWAQQPTPDLLGNMGSISSYCDCKCDFCFEKSNDAHTRGGISFGRTQLSLVEASTRARYYSPAERRGLPMSSRFTLEPFTNPRCLTILETIRERTRSECINLTTNGAALDEETVARLARLKPIFVAVSLNAGNAQVRYRTMHDRSMKAAETAMECLPLLRQYGIPYVGSYVPWPTKPLSDLEDAVHHFDRHDAVAARVCLPSWTRFSFGAPPFDSATYWQEIVTIVQNLRREVEIPIHLMPNMFQLKTTRPFIQGAIKRSPAARAGLRHGDLITAIDGQPVYTRPQASGMLAERAQDTSLTQTVFSIDRDGERLGITVPHVRNMDSLEYPFRQLAEPGASRMWAGTLGIHLADGFALSDFLRMRDIVLEYPGKKILLFVSELGAPYFQEGVSMLGEEAGFLEKAEVFVQNLRPEYWSGNVIIGDLWVVEDVVKGARSWMDRHGIKPDVVLLPSTFLSTAGYDLLGRCYLEAERALDVEIRLLPCNPISI